MGLERIDASKSHLADSFLRRGAFFCGAGLAMAAGGPRTLACMFSLSTVAIVAPHCVQTASRRGSFQLPRALVSSHRPPGRSCAATPSRRRLTLPGLLRVSPLPIVAGISRRARVLWRI